MNLQLKDHPSRTKNPITGEMVPTLPNDRSVWVELNGVPTMVAYCGADNGTPINFIVPPSKLPLMFRDDIVQEVNRMRGGEESQFSQMIDLPEEEGDDEDEEFIEG